MPVKTPQMRCLERSVAMSVLVRNCFNYLGLKMSVFYYYLQHPRRTPFGLKLVGRHGGLHSWSTNYKSRYMSHVNPVHFKIRFEAQQRSLLDC